MKMASHKFGTEVRMIGEMLITAKKVGAGRDFFATLAHDEKLFWKVLEVSRVRPVFNVMVDYAYAGQATVNVYFWSASLGRRNEGITNLDEFTTDVTQELIEGGFSLEVEIALFWFDQRVNSDQVIEEMQKEKYRPAALVELDAFQKKFPNIQRKIPIVGLGTVIKPDDSPAFVPYLDYTNTENNPERIFKLAHRAPEWDTSIRFAAVPEEIV